MHVNLLPAGFRRELLIRRCVRAWAPAWIVCLTGGLLYVGVAYCCLKSARRSLAVTESLCEPISLIRADSTQVARQLQDARVRKTKLLTVAPPNKAQPVLSLVSSSVHGLEGRIQVRRLTFRHSVERSSGGEKEPKPAAAARSLEKGELTLEAVAISDSAIAEFIAKLRNAKVLQHVELKSSTEMRVGEHDCRRFEVICQFGSR